MKEKKDKEAKEKKTSFDNTQWHAPCSEMNVQLASQLPQVQQHDAEKREY